MNNLPNKKTSQIQYAIFDVGQVIYPFSLNPLVSLLQSQTTTLELYQNSANPLHYNYNPYMKGELTTEEFIKDLCRFCHVVYTPDIASSLNEALHQGCGERFTETQEAITFLKQHNITICLLSNALPILSDTGKGIAAPEHTFTSYKLGLLKPDYRIYEAVKNTLNVPYSHLLFIDDKAKNVTAAHELGIHGIVFNRTTILSEIKSILLSEK